MSALKSSPPFTSSLSGLARGAKREASAGGIAAAIVLALTVCAPAGAQTPGAAQQLLPGPVPTTPVSKPQKWAPGRLLVQPRPGLSDEEFDKILKVPGAKRIGRIPGINVHIVQLPPNASEKAAAALLARNPHVKFAEPDMMVGPDGTANDPYYASEWHLSTIGAPTAWDTSTGAGITVAILDSGVDSSHPDLQGQLVAGWNFYDNNSNTADVTGHGTAVAGTVAAATNNGLGVSSIAPGAKIMPIRICDTSGIAYFSTVATALTWAADHGARVANISFSGMTGSSTVQSAAQYLKNKGGETVVSAGNTGANEGYANSTSLITVSATQNSTDAFSTWSSYGNNVDISAPGYYIYSTVKGGSYGGWWGTSFSSPVVAGTVALMMAANPAIAPGTLENLLFSTAQDLGTPGWDMYYGWGRVNTAAAVQAAKGGTTSDTSAPTVSLSAPTGGATVSGLVAVNVSASDNVGVTHVDLVVNGTKLASDTASPYAFSWDSTKVPDGSATLLAYAYDAAGNYSSSSVSVNVSNTTTAKTLTTTDTTPPTTSITSPLAGAKVSGYVTVKGTATDNVKVVGTWLYIDGKVVSSSTGGSVGYTWSTSSIAAGSHTIQITSKDAAGNVGSSSIQVTK